MKQGLCFDTFCNSENVTKLRWFTHIQWQCSCMLLERFDGYSRDIHVGEYGWLIIVAIAPRKYGVNTG